MVPIFSCPDPRTGKKCGPLFSLHPFSARNALIVRLLHFSQIYQIIKKGVVEGRSGDIVDLAVKTSVKKMNLRSFKLNRVYLDPLNMSNAGDFSRG